MAITNGILRGLLRGQPVPQGHPVQAAAGTTGDSERDFLASIAHLSLEEQQKQLQKREWYRRLAQRQGIMEVEHQIDRHWGSDD